MKAITYRYQHTEWEPWTISTARFKTAKEAGEKVGWFLECLYEMQVYPIVQLIEVDD